MKAHKMPEVHATHPNVTPLIDVVMCLIIFYMLVAKIGVDTGREARIQLPVSLQGMKLSDMGNTITLNVSQPVVGEEPMITTLDPKSGYVDIKLIEGANHPLASYLKLMKGQNADFKVIIRADQNLDYRFLEPVLLICAEVPVKNVNFAAREPEAGGKPLH